MAALGESDLQKILGPNWRERMGSAGPGEGRKQAMLTKKARIDTISGHRFTAGSVIVIGLGLTLSAVVTAKGMTFWITLAVAIALFVCGALWLLLTTRQLRRLEDAESEPIRATPAQSYPPPEAGRPVR